MTSVDRLLIKGIRSFSPDNKNIIEFYKPLTIIVGQNGAGKTTIIECLKYACTGEFPPNASKGQAFVHDPKAAAEREVKAQVKMRFRALTGKPIVVVRNIQLQQRDKKMEVKTLESVLQTYTEAGEKATHSLRCADLDKEVPELIGASKPILESVIFCHQEDSNWPLSEPAALKKRFDDIFAATRYTKALDAIKKERKAQAELVKEYQLRLQTIATVRDQALSLEKDLEKLQKTVADHNKELGVLKEALTEKGKRIEEIKAKKQGIANSIAELDLMKTRRETLAEQSRQTFSELSTEFTETDEELRQLEKRFLAEMERFKSREKQIVEQMQTLERQKAAHQKAASQLAEEYGSLVASVKAQEKLIEERNQMMADFAAQYSVPGFEQGPFSSDEARKLLQKGRALLETHKERLAATKREAAAKAEGFTVQVQQRSDRASSLREKLNQGRTQLTGNESRLKALEREIQAKQEFHGRLDAMTTRIAKESAAVEELKRKLNVDDTNRRIEALKDEKQEVEAKMAQTNEVLRTLNKQASVRAQLKLNREKRKAKEDQYTLLLNKRRGELREALDAEPSPATLHKDLQRAVASKKALLAEASKKWQAETLEKSQLDGQIKVADDQLQKLQSEMKTHEARLAETGDKELPTLLKESEVTLEKKRKEVTMSLAAEIIYENFQELAKSNHECPLCERVFEQSHELKRFLNNVNDLLGKVPDEMAKAQRAVKEAEVLYTRLQALRPDWDALVRAKQSGLPALQTKVSELKRQAAQVQAAVESSGAERDRLSRIEQQAQSLLSDGQSISQAYSEFVELSKAVEKDEATLRSTSDDVRTTDEVTAEYDDLQRRSATLSGQIDTLRRQLQSHQSEIHEQEAALLRHREESLSMKTAADDILRIRQSIADLTAQNETLTREIADNEVNLTKLQQDMQDLQEQKKRHAAQAHTSEEQVNAEKERFQSRLSQLESVCNQINQSPVEVLRSNLDAVIQRKRELEEKLQQANNDARALADERRDKLDMLAARESSRRNIADNIKYRELKAEISGLEQKIREKQQSLANAGLDENDLNTNLERLEHEFDKQKSQYNNLTGSRSTYQEQIKKIEKDLKKSEYRDVRDNYRTMLISLETSEMAKSDLDKYHTALDHALMKFHSMKMQEINKIIRELWQSTYQGKDIDSIAIRSAEDAAGGKASYNYRVVMIKNDVELDMRGRCSAGQKVLASLIIRLALAETFCINCGIFALDEPTTNLDKANIEAFANALVSIIETRSKQSNFQLIIITHDEDFVSLIGRSEHADYYWRVSKDDSGHSKLERQSIMEL